MSAAVASSNLQTTAQGLPTITFTNNSLVNSFFDATGTATNPTLLMEDYLYNQNSQTGSFTLNNLTAGATFTLVLYGSGDEVGQGTSFTLAGATGGNSASTLRTTGTDRNIANGIGDAYNTFTGTVGAGRTLTVTAASNGTTQFVILNGLQLQEVVPEPSTWALMVVGAGALGLSLRRRRCSQEQ